MHADGQKHTNTHAEQSGLFCTAWSHKTLRWIETPPATISRRPTFSNLSQFNSLSAQLALECCPAWSFAGRGCDMAAQRRQANEPSLAMTLFAWNVGVPCCPNPTNQFVSDPHCKNQSTYEVAEKLERLLL